MNFKVSHNIIFNMEVLTWIFQLTSNEIFLSWAIHWNCIEHDLLPDLGNFVVDYSKNKSFFTLFPFISQQAYLHCQIRVLHIYFVYNIIRLTRLSCSIICNVRGVTKFFFHADHLSIGALDRMESRQSSINNWRNRIKNIKAFIRRYCKVLWLLFT